MTDARNRRYEICHLFLSPLKHESRLFKELATAEKLFPAAKLMTIGLDREVEELSGLLQGRYPFERIRLWTARLPKILPFQLVKYVEWTLRAAWRARVSGAKVLHCHSLAALPATVLARLGSSRTRILYDAHELETRRANMSRGRQRATEFLERLLMRYVSEILVVGPSIMSNYDERYPGKQISLLLNLPVLVRPEPRMQMRDMLGILPGRNFLIYIGALSPMRGIELLLEALESLKGWHCLFLGAGPLEGAIKHAALKNDRIHHHPPVAESDIVNVVAEADLSYAVIDCSADSYRFALPNKFFQSLSAGIPVMVNIENVDMLSIGRESGMVFGVEYDVDAILRFIETFPERRAPRKPQDFSWEGQEEMLLLAYRRLWTREDAARN